jgi:hypothetical protein
LTGICAVLTVALAMPETRPPVSTRRGGLPPIEPGPGKNGQ